MVHRDTLSSNARRVLVFKCLNNYSTEFQARVSTSLPLHNLRLHLHKTQPKCVLLIFSVELIYLVTSLHDAEIKLVKSQEGKHVHLDIFIAPCFCKYKL